MGQWLDRLRAKAAAHPRERADKGDKAPLPAVLAVTGEGGARAFEGGLAGAGTLRAATGRSPEADSEAYEERAAILEYDAGLPRATAEAHALLMLDGAPVPHRVAEAIAHRLLPKGWRPTRD